MNPDKQQLLDSIQPNMKLDKSFFLKVYGYEISFPGFAEQAVKALEDAGCGRAREYYNMIVAEYQKKRDENLKPVVKELHKKWDEDWKRLQKGSEEKREQIGKTPKQNWKEMSKMLGFQSMKKEK